MYISHECREKITTQKWDMNDILLSCIIVVLKIICLFRFFSSQTVIQEQDDLMTTNNYRQNISETVFKGWSLRQVLFPIMSEEKLIQSESSNEQKLIWYLAVAKEKLISSLTFCFAFPLPTERFYSFPYAFIKLLRQKSLDKTSDSLSQTSQVKRVC